MFFVRAKEEGNGQVSKYDEAAHDLLAGKRFIENVSAAVWNYPTLDEAIAAIAGKSIEELVAAARQRGGPGLISADELRAAGCFDFPPGWRKSLSAKQDRLPLFDDDDTVPTKKDSTPCDPDSGELSDELP
ncbi:MAG TPA: hypothetical protein VFI31_01030 [Pirellulales bacterium]|nr:hypothetical protein [Pirellulales bacterium]